MKPGFWSSHPEFEIGEESDGNVRGKLVTKRRKAQLAAKKRRGESPRHSQQAD